MKILITIKLLIGIILLLFSVPLSSKMKMELVYNWEMNNKYKITELNEMYKGVPTGYHFFNSYINVYHKLNNNPPYKDPWGNVINPANVYISIDGETKEVLKNYPVKIKEKGLNQ